jgi:hypothetical protein
LSIDFNRCSSGAMRHREMFVWRDHHEVGNRALNGLFG